MFDASKKAMQMSEIVMSLAVSVSAHRHLNTHENQLGYWNSDDDDFVKVLFRLLKIRQSLLEQLESGVFQFTSWKGSKTLKDGRTLVWSLDRPEDWSKLLVAIEPAIRKTNEWKCGNPVDSAAVISKVVRNIWNIDVSDVRLDKDVKNFFNL